MTFLVISGNSGSGKSTFAEALSEASGLTLFEEPWQANPFLAKAYENPKKYRYDSDRWFLEAVAKQHADCSKGGIQDRGILENYEVFVKIHHQEGVLTGKQFEDLSAFYDEVCEDLVQPDQLIYLQVNPQTTLRRMQSRNRAIEAGFKLETTELYHQHLEAMFGEYQGPKLLIPEFELDELDKQIQLIKW